MNPVARMNWKTSSLDTITSLAGMYGLVNLNEPLQLQWELNKYCSQLITYAATSWDVQQLLKGLGINARSLNSEQLRQALEAVIVSDFNKTSVVAPYYVTTTVVQYIWNQRHNPRVIAEACQELYRRRRCIACDEPIKSFGTARKNGKDHNDWNTRLLHKKCWCELQRTQALQYQLSHRAFTSGSCK